MAVTATVSDVARSIRAVDSTDVTAELTALLDYATAEVTRIAPNAPAVVQNRASIAIVGYYIRPAHGRARDGLCKRDPQFRRWGHAPTLPPSSWREYGNGSTGSYLSRPTQWGELRLAWGGLSLEVGRLRR